MKILLLYTPRSGSTSIMRYFEKLKPEYQIFNQPWSSWKGTKNYRLNDFLGMDKLFVKNTIDWVMDNKEDSGKMKSNSIPTIQEIFNFFDKVLVLSRKDITQQSISLYFSSENNSYLETYDRLYNIESIDETRLNEIKSNLTKDNDLVNELVNLGVSHYYYEDLYYESFNDFFQTLNLDYHNEYFDRYLNTTKRYKKGEVTNKVVKTFI